MVDYNVRDDSLSHQIDKDYLIEAYEILNDVERNVWRYINEGKF